ALGVHENTIRHWVDSGTLQAQRLPGSRFRRIVADSVQRLLDKRQPSYHDLFITTDTLSRTAISNLPFDYEVSCNRVGGWCLWRTGSGEATLVAGEYDDRGLRLDVAGVTIVDSLARDDEATR